MASVFNRGTKDRPNWYAKIKNPDGKWDSVPTSQPTKEAAKRWAIAKQAEVENSKVGIRPRTPQTPALTAVSYTHLDVYKRQALCLAGELARCRVAALP